MKSFFKYHVLEFHRFDPGTFTVVLFVTGFVCLLFVC